MKFDGNREAFVDKEQEICLESNVLTPLISNYFL